MKYGRQPHFYIKYCENNKDSKYIKDINNYIKDINVSKYISILRILIISRKESIKRISRRANTSRILKIANFTRIANIKGEAKKLTK